MRYGLARLISVSVSQPQPSHFGGGVAPRGPDTEIADSMQRGLYSADESAVQCICQRTAAGFWVRCAEKK